MIQFKSMMAVKWRLLIASFMVIQIANRSSLADAPFHLGDSYIGFRKDMPDHPWYGLSGSFLPPVPQVIDGNIIWIAGVDVKSWPGYGASNSCDIAHLVYRSFTTGSNTGD